MKQKYSHLQPATGIHNAGICSILIAPREWLASPILLDFATWNITQPILLKNNLEFIRLDLIPESYTYKEKAKLSDAGQYWETELTGELNNLEAYTHQILNSLRHHRFIAIVKDAKGDTRLVGDHNNGLNFMFGVDVDNKNMEEHIPISLTMQTPKPAPYMLF